jgi:hypothetical protein
VNEVERLVVRRVTVEVKKRQCIGHAASINRSRQRRRRARAAIGGLHKKGGARRSGPPPSQSQNLAIHSALLTWLLLAALLTGFVLATLLLLTGLTGLLLAALLRVRVALLLLVASRILLIIRHCDVLRCFWGQPQPNEITREQRCGSAIEFCLIVSKKL